MAVERITTIQTSDERVLTVARNGFATVTIHDHPNPGAHAGHTIDFANARRLAAALVGGEHGSLSTHEGAVLKFQGIHLGDVRSFERRATTPQDAPLDRVRPDVLNAQAKRSRGPWSLNERQRLALALALTHAVGGEPISQEAQR